MGEDTFPPDADVHIGYSQINGVTMKYSDQPNDLLQTLRIIALAGGKEAMRHYGSLTNIKEKADNSPVTEADIAVDRILVSGLNQHFPSIGVVTEERSKSHQLGSSGKPYFLVDPIDGTKEFIKETGEFTINIGLIDNGEPVAGVVYAPAIGRMFSGLAGSGAYEDQADLQCTMLLEQSAISVKECIADEITAVASKSHLTPETGEFLQFNGISKCKNAGSSLKFCLLATGEADIYPRYGPTMEWDTAAGHAVLLAAGGHVNDLSGLPLVYGKTSLKNPNFIAASPTVSYRLPG